jgi:ParB-like chromosome segregation protein Spo0J
MTTLIKPTAETKANLSAHPLADIFPLMEGEEFDALVQDIKDNGLREPITLFENQILDGRNRYRAVIKAALQYRLKEENFRTYSGSDPLSLVVSANLHRRHLTESQRALIAARIVTTKLGDNQFNKPGITNKQAAAMLGVSQATVKTAKKVAESAAPEIKEQVLKGELRLNAAKDIIEKPKDQQLAELEKIKAEKQKEKEDKAKQKTGATKGNKVSKANQAMKDVDDFKAKWQSFDDMQRKAFVMWCEKELAKLLEYVREQQAMAGATQKAA